MNYSKHYRVIEVKYLGPTTHRGSRVKLVDKRMGQSKTLDYNYAETDKKTQAWKWLEKHGLNPVCWGTTHDTAIIMCDNWNNFVDIGLIKNNCILANENKVSDNI